MARWMCLGRFGNGVYGHMQVSVIVYVAVTTKENRKVHNPAFT